MKAYHQVAGRKGAIPAFRFDADGRATRFLLRDAYCEDPNCRGGEADVILADEADPSRRIRFSFDLMKPAIHLPQDTSETDLAIATEFAHDRGAFCMLARRRQVVRAWGLARWNEGPPVVAEDRCYAIEEFDVEPGGYAMPFESGGEEWFALDQYCVNPECDCEDVNLSFVKSQKVMRAAPGIRVDLRTGTARVAASDELLTAEQRRILNDFREEVPNWQHELGLRRKLIREIAAARLHSEGAPVPEEPPLVEAVGTGPRTGRNDPCPCGSGRKFKRCCGRAPAGTSRPTF